MKPEQIWQAALGELQLETTRATFNTWLRDTRLVAYEDGVFVIGVRNGYAKDWLENRLAPTIRRKGIRLAVLAVPARGAQEAAEDLCQAGIRGILSFSPVRLNLPDHVAVLPVDLAAKLQQLNYFIGPPKRRRG